MWDLRFDCFCGYGGVLFCVCGFRDGPLGWVCLWATCWSRVCIGAVEFDFMVCGGGVDLLCWSARLLVAVLGWGG